MYQRYEVVLRPVVMCVASPHTAPTTMGVMVGVGGGGSGEWPRGDANTGDMRAATAWCHALDM